MKLKVGTRVVDNLDFRDPKDTGVVYWIGKKTHKIKWKSGYSPSWKYPNNKVIEDKSLWTYFNPKQIVLIRAK